MLKEFGLVPSLLTALDDPYVSQEQPYWGGQKVWVDILSTLPKVKPSRGTPFFQDADKIMVAVQLKYLNGELSRRQGRARRRGQPDRGRDRPADRRVAATARSGGPSVPPGHQPLPGIWTMRLRTRTAYAFLTPYLLIFLAFWIWPIINSFWLSFLNTRSANWTFNPRMTWGRLLVDPAFANALWNTLIILVIQVPIMIALATVLAVLLNSSMLKARGLFRFAFFAPVVVGEVAYAAVFRLMFNHEFGIINKMLAAVGVPAIPWLSSPNAAMAVIIIARHLALGGLQRHHHPRRTAVDPRGRLRGGDAGRRLEDAAVLLHHAAAAEAGHRALRRDLRHRHDAALLRAVPDHQPGRPRPGDRDARPLPLPAGLRRLQFRLRVGDRLHHRRARRRHLAPQSLAWKGTRMRSKSSAELRRGIALHAALVPLALIWLFPLWMMFVFSTMPDNGIFSPAIVLTPSDQFVDNFNLLESDTDFIRATTISILVAAAYTFLSVALTSMAGWALACYRFAARASCSRSFSAR